MDEKLLSQALKYHGADLLYSLQAEHQEQPSAAVLSQMDRKQHRSPEIQDAEFQKHICAFIGRKSDMLFKPVSEEDKKRRQNHEVVDDAYAIMPALESFLDVPSHLRRGHFYRSLRPDDCVSGVVLSVLENGLRIQLLCVDKGCARDIDDLDIQAFCPVRELPKLYPNESALQAFQEKDIVRGIVLAVGEESEKIIVSLHEKAVPDKNIYPRTGLITEEEFPVHYRRKKQIDGSPFEELLHSILGFNNMGNVRALVEQLGMQEDSSYMRYLASLEIPEKEYAEGLRKWQSQKLAYHSVAQGVEMFKSGKHLEAMQYFNRALQIDSENVEALVARGALYANKENFHHAIQDFKQALSINPKHNNARNYLIETLLAFGRTCEDDQNFEEAMAHYSDVLKIDPNRVEAKELIKNCQIADGKNKKEGENESSILSKSADKLRQLIQEDKKEEKRMKKHRRQSSGSSEKPRKRKRSSSSSSSSSSEDRRKHKKPRKRKRSESSSSSSSEDSRKHKTELRPLSSVKAKKRRKTEKEGKRQSLDRNEEVKAGRDLNRKDKKSEIEPQQVKPAGLLTVSSLEYFNKNTAIPGLGSPPASSDAAEDRLVKQRSQDNLHGRNSEGPQDNVKMLRRDDFLMAEREKFYRDNKDVYKKSPSFTKANSSPSSSSTSSSSSSSSTSSSTRSSRSPSCSSSAVERKRSQGSQSKPQTEKLPLVTGIKGLDKYLGGAKELLERIQSKGKPTDWALFSDLFSAVSRSTSRGHRSNSNDISHSKISGLRSSEDNATSTRASEDTGRTCQEPAHHVHPETHHRTQQQDDRFENTSRCDSTEADKFKGKGSEQGCSKNELYSAGDKETLISMYKNESSSIKQLTSVKSAEDSKETILDAKSGISRLPEERVKSSSFTEQDKPQEKENVSQWIYRSSERNDMQSSKPHEQQTDGVEQNFMQPEGKNLLCMQSVKLETEVVGLDFQNKQQLTDKSQEKGNIDQMNYSSSERNNVQSLTSLQKTAGGVEKSLMCSQSGKYEKEVVGLYFQKNKQLLEKQTQNMTPGIFHQALQGDNQRLKNDNGAPALSSRGKDGERSNRRSRSTERKQRRSRSTEREQSSSSSSTERKHSRSRSTERKRRRSRSTEREQRRSRSIERKQSRSRSTERKHRRSRSTERKYRRSRSTERKYRRSRSTERKHSRSRSTERKRSRSRSTERGRKSRSIEKTRSRSRRKSISRDRDQGNTNLNRQKDLVTSREGGNRNSSRKEGRNNPDLETRYRRDQSIERDKGRNRKYSQDRDIKPRGPYNLTSNRNIYIPKENEMSNWMNARAIEEEINRRVRERLKEEETKLRKKFQFITKNRWDSTSTELGHSKLNRWDSTSTEPGHSKTSRWDSTSSEPGQSKTSRWDCTSKDPGKSKTSRWDITSSELGQSKTGRWDNTSKEPGQSKTSRWDSPSTEPEQSKTSKWDKISTELGISEKSRWDSPSREPGQSKINRWDKDSKNIDQAKTVRWDLSQSCSSDTKTDSSDNESKNPFVKYFVGSNKDPARKGSTPSNLTPNVKSPPPAPLAIWDIKAVPIDKNEKTAEATKHVAKTAEKEKTSESLSDLEKFLIDLKQQKKKQWIAEGKLKKKP